MRKLAVLLFFVLNFLTILYFWASSSGPLLFQGTALAFMALGRLSGLLAVYFVLFQFLLIGRSPWIERAFGLDRLTRIHALNGKLAIIFILLHPLLLIAGYSISANISFLDQHLQFLTNYEDVPQAYFAVNLFFIIVFLSLSIARKRLKYETWYFVHLFTYLAVFLSWGHQLKFGEDFHINNLFVWYWYGLYIFVLGSHIIFRFIRPWYFFMKHRFFVLDIVKESSDVTSVIIGGRNMENFKINPGQFMLVRFLTKGIWWQTHPFSLSRLPDVKTLRLSIKNVGDFTSLISTIKKNVAIYIDGPYGLFTKNLMTKRKAVLIAGGIGITPIRSLVEQLLKEKISVILIYSNKTVDEIVFKNEFDALQKQYVFPIYYFLSQEQKNGYSFGRVDADKVMNLVKDIKERDVFICGPIPMMDRLRGGLIRAGISKTQIHYEKFSL